MYAFWNVSFLNDVSRCRVSAKKKKKKKNKIKIVKAGKAYGHNIGILAEDIILALLRIFKAERAGRVRAILRLLEDVPLDLDDLAVIRLAPIGAWFEAGTTDTASAVECHLAHCDKCQKVLGIVLEMMIFLMNGEPF